MNTQRQISSRDSREVYARDGGRCTFVSDDGRRCDACHFLQLDHIKPHATGRQATVDNLRLRCGAHNRRSARLYFGTAQVEAAIANARTRRPTHLDPR